MKYSLNLTELSLPGNAQIFCRIFPIKSIYGTSNEWTLKETRLFGLGDVYVSACLFGGSELINPSANMITLEPCGPRVSMYTNTCRCTHKHNWGMLPVNLNVQKPTATKHHFRVSMSTLADATLIQSASESHQAEWLRERAGIWDLHWQCSGDLEDYRQVTPFGRSCR